MVCRRSLLSAVALALAAAAAHGGFEVRRVVADATLIPGANDIQELSSARRVTQTLTPPAEPIAGVELFVSRYPRTESLDIAIGVRDGDREIGFGVMPIPDQTPRPVRVVFPAYRAMGAVTIEVWAPAGRPGHAAGVRFYPVDWYSGGELRVNGRMVRGDLAFRVLARDSSEVWLETGLDLTGVQGRFPSENLVEAGELRQEFIVPRDSLVGVEFVTGTGGREVGPGMRWDVEVSGRAVRSGRIEGISDNVAQRITFVPITASEGVPVTLRIACKPSGGEARLWLCGRAPGTGALTVGDHMVDGSLVLTTLHLAVPTDSLRVVLAVDALPAPAPGTPLVGACAVTQTLQWPCARTARDLAGFRLALGHQTAAGALVYEVRAEHSGGAMQRDSLRAADLRANEFVWCALGSPHGGKRLAVTLGGVGAKTDAAVRFWWMSGNAYGWGEATGCVPRPEGDCQFQMARAYPLGTWVREFPGLVAELAPEVGTRLLRWLLGMRMMLLACSGVAGVVLGLPRRCRAGTVH